MNKLFLLTLIALPVGLCAMDQGAERQLLLVSINSGDPAKMCSAAQLMGSQGGADREEYIAALLVAAEAVSPAGDTQAAHALAQWVTNYRGTLLNKTTRLEYVKRVRARQAAGADPLRGPLGRLVLDKNAQVYTDTYVELGDAFRSGKGLNVDNPADHFRELTVYMMGSVRFPADAVFPHNLGTFFARNEKLWVSTQIPRALSHGTRALELAPELPRVLGTVGTYHECLGNKTRALQLYKRALTQDKLVRIAEQLDDDSRRILLEHVCELEPASCVIL